MILSTCHPSRRFDFSSIEELLTDTKREETGAPGPIPHWRISVTLDKPKHSTTQVCCVEGGPLASVHLLRFALFGGDVLGSALTLPQSIHTVDFFWGQTSLLDVFARLQPDSIATELTENNRRRDEQKSGPRHYIPVGVNHSFL